MKKIRPVSDLRNNFSEISKIVHETAEPVFLTKNGFGDMVVLSMEAYENLQFNSEVYFKSNERSYWRIMNVYVGIFTNRNAGYGGYSKIYISKTIKSHSS